ncbi:MAG: Ig-like domain-containing protein, partial [Bacteroidales bacterium]|nr:Ig-like domain-containing protein [Bacteroidales bacterium]
MKLYNNVIYLLIALMLYILGSCANTTTPPTGGIKDTIPPRLLKVIPDSGRVNFPLKGGVIEMKFDEYIVLKEPQKSLFLSPPLEKRVETKIRGKSIIITFPLSLDSSQTYSLNFGNSIVDNNEGNQFYNYVYPFSTGDYIDSLMVSGTILNAVTLLPAEDITIALYKDNSDSVLYNSLPDAYSKSDKFGFFVIRNIEPRPYRVFAFKD